MSAQIARSWKEQCSAVTMQKRMQASDELSGFHTGSMWTQRYAFPQQEPASVWTGGV